MFGENLSLPFPVHIWRAQQAARPALVLFDLGLDVLICRITSAAKSGLLDIPISGWAQAGLAKPSIARLDRVVTAEKTLLGRRLGDLAPPDAAVIRAAWNQHMQL